MIRRLTLQNWRAYEHLELDFRPGATFVVAPNGVGKSSIVEGARFALFGFVPPAREGAARVTRTGTTSAAVDVELPSGRLLTVSRPYPAKVRGSAVPTVLLDGEPQAPEILEALLADEYGAEPAFLARLAMLHSSTVFGEAKGLDLRDHLCHVFGVDGLLAALDQTKALAAVAKKTVDAARKPAGTMADDELAALTEVEARAAELIDAADAERAAAEQALAAARAGAEAGQRYEAWKAASDRYTAVATAVANDAAALLGRDLSPAAEAGAAPAVADLPGLLEAAEAEAVAALDDVRRRRAQMTGRAEAIRSGLAELEGAEGSCPVCRRPLEPDDVEVARAGHERDLAVLDAELASLDEQAAARLVTELRQLRHRLVNEPLPGDPPPQPHADQAATSETQAMARFEAAVASAAERRAILAEARRRREAGESARVELEAVTSAFERAATLEAAAAALDAARLRILTESVEPLEELLADNWRNLFVDRPGVGLEVTARSAAASGPSCCSTSSSVTARRWSPSCCCGSSCCGRPPGSGSSGSTNRSSTSTPTPGGPWRCCWPRRPRSRRSARSWSPPTKSRSSGGSGVRSPTPTWSTCARRPPERFSGVAPDEPPWFAV